LHGIQSVSQKEFDKEFTKIKEGFSKIVRLIQVSNEDQYIVWMMEKNKVQWQAMHLKQRHQYLVWKKDKELKKAELE